MRGIREELHKLKNRVSKARLHSDSNGVDELLDSLEMNQKALRKLGNDIQAGRELIETLRCTIQEEKRKAEEVQVGHVKTVGKLLVDPSGAVV